MPNGRVNVSAPLTSKHLLKFTREKSAGMAPEDGVALYPLPDTSIHDDAFSTALSARSHAVGCWIWAVAAITLVAKTNRMTYLFMIQSFCGV